MAVTAGYDVGGAHLKVALAEDGRIVAVRQIACPLWRGLDRLDAALSETAPLTARAARHFVTMTAELCELFPDRRSGVAALVAYIAAALGPGVRIWMGPRAFGAPEEALRNPMSVASTNFLASAALVAAHMPDALLIDMGSTTTDIIPIVGGVTRARGLTDGERLASGELVYSGLTRTDVAAAARLGTFRDVVQPLAAGGFATMADVHRVLGNLPEGVDQHETADGRGKSFDESVARFARVFGRDAADGTVEDWRAAARSIIARQMLDLAAACAQVLTASHVLKETPVVAAGIGAEAVRELAAGLGRHSHRFGELIDTTDDCRTWATYCAPAVAVALLGDRHLDR